MAGATQTTMGATVHQPTYDPDTALAWLTLLHGQAPGLTHICSSGDWTGRTYTDPQAALRYITYLDAEQRQGIYARVTTLRTALPPGRRGGASDTAALPALWADLDLAGPAHQHHPDQHHGRDLPPDEDAGRALIALSGLPTPTLWIHSGHGLYPIWLLDTPQPVDDANREHLAQLAALWQHVIHRTAATMGWHYGPGVGDLARVLRIPGTVNRKLADQPQLCQVLDHTGPRHHLANLQAAAQTALTATPAAAPAPARVPNQRRGGAAPAPASPAAAAGDDDPGDAYNRNGPSWADILTPHGWTLHNTVDGVEQWTRPGKDTGVSATTNALGSDRLHVFSTNAPPFVAGESYHKFAAHTLLNHAGDYAQAAKQLLSQGYGTPVDQGANQAADLDLLVPGWRNDQPGIPTGIKSPPDPHPVRPPLDVTNTAVAADWLRDHLGRGRLAGMFNRGDQIVHTPAEGQDGYQPCTADGRDHDGPAQIRPVTASTLASRISWTYQCQRTNVDGITKPALYPTTAARVAVDVPDMLPHLRQLAGVTHTPLIRPDGTTLDQPGYDPATRLLYLPDPHLTIPPVPDHPTADQLAAAVALLDEMTAGFPWAGDHDRANYYGLLLTPLLRLLTPPPYKLFAIGAPMPGSGKTLLATVARIIHGGIFRAEMPEDQAELRKAISTILDITTGPIIHFDNVTGAITSSVLAGLLTSGKWEDRRLGTMEHLTRPNDRIWTFTGNNLTFGGDLPRRTVWVTIDPQMPHPENRTEFAIGDLEKWVTNRRGQILAALLTIIRAWVANGRPTPTPTRSDGFTTWTTVTTGILTNAGVPGVFDHPESTRDGGADDDGWGQFLVAIHTVYGPHPWTAVELLNHVDRVDVASIPLDALPGNLAERIGKSSPAGAARSLGKWLRNRVGRWADGFTVASRGRNHANQQVWQIIPYEAGIARSARSARSADYRRARVSNKTDTPELINGNVPTQPKHSSQTSHSSQTPTTCTQCGRDLDPVLAPKWHTARLHPSCAPHTTPAGTP